MRIQFPVDSGRYPSIFDVMRDRYGIAARMEVNPPSRLARLPGGLPISAQLPGSRRPPLARRLPRSVRLALVAVDVVDGSPGSSCSTRSISVCR